jgi:5,10-methylenetetrahydromethanopterin reductase
MAADRVRPAVGLCFDRTFPPALVPGFARRLDEGGADQLWIIEDCFYTAAVSLAAAALTATERLQVGLGILPAVARNPAVTAMEIATLCALAPGRVLPGIGHGVQDWMEQMGARTASPLTTLEEVIVAVTRLLRGERVTMHGRHVHLDGVQLDRPPADPPPVLAGVRGPRSLAMAGRVAGGVVLAEPCPAEYVEAALGHAEPAAPGDTPFHVAVFSLMCVRRERIDAYRETAPRLAALLADPNPGLQALPFFDEMMDRFDRSGRDGLVSMPAEWWTSVGPIGTLADAEHHLGGLVAEGVHSIGLFPGADPVVASEQLDQLLHLVS